MFCPILDHDLSGLAMQFNDGPDVSPHEVCQHWERKLIGCHHLVVIRQMARPYH